MAVSRLSSNISHRSLSTLNIEWQIACEGNFAASFSCRDIVLASFTCVAHLGVRKILGVLKGAYICERGGVPS